MPEPATLEDFEEVVRRIGADAIRELGRESAAITADAAAKGALSNNRLVFSYADALEECWKRAADEAMAQLRRWVAETKVGRTPLRDVTERELRRLVAALIEVSRVRPAAARFSNQAMLKEPKERIDALEVDLGYRLRQFDINMGAPGPESSLPKWRNWLREHLKEIVITVVGGVIVAGILELLGLT